MSLKKSKTGYRKRAERLSAEQQRNIELALKAVSSGDWKARFPHDRQQLKGFAAAYRKLAKSCDELGRNDLAQTLNFIATEMELGIGLGPYVNKPE